MKTRVLFLNLTFAACVTIGSNPQGQPSQNLFQIVILPDSIKQQLVTFLQEKEKLSSPASAIYVYNYANPKDLRFKDGLYTFRLPGPHFQPRLFIFEKGQLQLFESIDINGLLEEYLNYIKRSGIEERHKIEYLHLIWRFLDEGYKRESE